MRSSSDTALLIVDVQNDFLPPDGSLAVENGRGILSHIVALLSDEWDWPLVVASQDYHPPGHVSFASSHPGEQALTSVRVRDKQGTEIDQMLWPDHCVQGTQGCKLEASVERALQPWKAKGRYHLVQKGTSVDLDAYSAFCTPLTPSPSPEHASPLTSHLRTHGIATLVVLGIATDVCVKSTARDALSEGFGVLVVEEACRGVKAEDSERALRELEGKGARIVRTVEEIKKMVRASQ